MDAGEQTTGTRDEHYNLVSVLYHALQGADTCNVYALDAEAAGDERLAAFFREAGVVQTQLAERAKGQGCRAAYRRVRNSGATRRRGGTGRRTDGRAQGDRARAPSARDGKSTF